MSNLSTPFMGDYVRRLQGQINTLQSEFSTVFPQDGSLVAQGDIKMGGQNIANAGEITCSVLNYGTLNPPVSSGGNVTGPLSSVDNTLVRYSGTTGQIVQGSPMTLSDDGKLAVGANIVDMSTPGVIDLAATNVRANGSPITTSAALSSVDGDIAILDGITGRSIRSSGIPAASIATKLSVTGGTMIGVINMDGNNITNAGTISGPTYSRAADDIVATSASSVTDGDIPVFDGVTGRIISSSGVQATTIGTKVNRGGDTMTGNLALGGHNLLSVNNIAGTTKTSAVNSLVTSSAAVAVDGDLAVFDSTTGKIIKSSGVAVTEIATKLGLSGGTLVGALAMSGNNITNIGSISGATKTSAVDDIVTSSATSTIDGDLAVFDSTTGKIIKSSGVAAATVSSKVNRAGDTMAGALSLGGFNLSSVGLFSGTIKTMNPNAIVTTASEGVVDSNIVVFDLTSGNVVKDSGVAIGAIAGKLNLSGGTMSGAIAMAGNNITNIGTISGAVKTSAVDSLVTSSAGSAVDSDIAVFDSTTGKIIKSSGVAVTEIATKLSLSGGVMTGNIDMGTNNIIGVGLLIGDGGTSRDADNIVSNAGTAVAGNVAVFSGATGKIIMDSGISLAAYLPLTGGTLAGALIMAGHDITNIGNISGGTNSRAADDIVSNTGASVNARVAIFSGTSGKVITDSGATLSQYALLSGATFAGAIAMGGNNITNVGNISGATYSRAADDIVSNAGAATAGNIAIFSGATGKIITDGSLATGAFLRHDGSVAMTGNLNMDNYAITTGAAGAVKFGTSVTTAATTSIAIGNSSLAASGAVAIGQAASADGSNGIAIGPSAAVSAASAIAIGSSASNSVANSCLIGDSAIANIRPNSAVCDLGTTSEPFRTVYVNTGLDSTAGLAVGGTNASSVTVGRSAITTSINGIFTCTQACVTWYTTVAYAPSFSANTPRLIPPSFSTATITTEFTYSAGVATYTGTRARLFKLDVDISYLQGASGASMRWFASKNASTAIGNQTQIFYQTNANNTGTRVAVHFSDIVSLVNTNTMQLAATCSALSSAVSIEFVTFSLVGLFN